LKDSKIRRLGGLNRVPKQFAICILTEGRRLRSNFEIRAEGALASAAQGVFHKGDYLSGFLFPKRDKFAEPLVG